MKTRRFSNGLLAAAVLAAGAMAQTTTTSSTATVQATSAPVGLGSSETAQVNVVNEASASSSGTAASCTGSISFVNSSGTAIGTATSFTVSSGQIASVALPFNKVGASGTRAEIRSVVSLTVTTGSGAAPCALATSLETYDTATGVTHLYLANGGFGGGMPGGFGGGPGGGH